MVMVAFLMAACVPTTYRFEGRPYDSRADAEMAAKIELADMLAQTSALADPVAGSVRIVIPSKSALLQRVVRRGTSEGRNYVATVLASGVRVRADAIVKRNVFARAVIEETEYPDHAEVPAQGSVVYLYIAADAGTSAWYYWRAGGTRHAINYDRGLRGVDRLQSFVEGVEALARQETAK